MKHSSRGPSPTPTAFSAISNYRTGTDSYRPLRDFKGATTVPTIDYRHVSKTHYAELGRYLSSYLAKVPPNSRSSARSKLTRLTIQQFHELSTDVYDELVRRKNEKEVPFLPVRDEFHPKRNQARQKLATLPASRFEDLSSDVYFELARRYPEFKEDPSGRGSVASTYDDYPAPDFPSSSPSRNAGKASGRASADRPSDSGYGGSTSSRRPSEDRRRPSETDFNGRKSEDTYRRPDDVFAGRIVGDESFSAALASRRKPSQDTSRKQDEREFGRRPTGPVSSPSDTTTTLPGTQSTTATSAVIIPNKSTMEEEYIDIPYGRDGRESGVTTLDERERTRDGLGGDNEQDSASEYPSPNLSSRSPLAGLSGLTARLKGVEDEDELVPGNKSGDDFYDKYGRSSVDSTGNSASNVRMATVRTIVPEDHEKLRRDYEYKIATMQTQITNLQRDLGDNAEHEKKRKESESRVRQLEEELEDIRQRAQEQSATARMLQKELEELKEHQQREARQAQEDRDELQIYRDRCIKLEAEQELRQETDTGNIIEQLQTNLQNLMIELNNLSLQNDELITSKDSDLILIRDLGTQLKEYKRKYEQAKTELRGFKATSQLFLPPKSDKPEDQLPVSPDGGVLDIHITAFQSAIDGLLTAGRSNAPTRVLAPMKSVVNAVTNIIEDVKIFLRQPQQDRLDVDPVALRALQDRTEATLSNLVAATKTHATSSGMSPVSLLDAAASHVSLTITDIGRMVCIRKSTKADQDQFSYAPLPAGFSPVLRSVEEMRAGHQRKPSQESTSSRLGRFSESPNSSLNHSRTFNDRRRPQSENSSSEQTNSPPPIFDTHGHSGGVVSDDSAQAEGSEDAWAELKPYLEAQTESIVYAIQSVLSGVRSPTPSPKLNENLTEIITIVSSIVAVCKDNLPPASAHQGNEILRELNEHANKLSEVQTLPEVTKDSRQIMAKSSFAIANSMKGLMKL